MTTYFVETACENLCRTSKNKYVAKSAELEENYLTKCESVERF